MFRYFVIALVLLFLVLQYRLWVGSGGRADVHRLKGEIEILDAENEKLRSRNDALEAEINDLKQGEEAMEERARTDLGMVKEGEAFYLIVEPPAKPVILPGVTPQTDSEADN